MKTAIYIEDGFTQVVLTPESDFERNALDSLRTAHHVTVSEGSFYHCQGGWARHSGGTESTMIIAGKET